MRTILVAAAAMGALSTSASAADLAARPYTKAPALVAPAYPWTGFYVFGGGGGGLWAADGNAVSTGAAGVFGPAGSFGPSGTALTRDQRLGGSGWFGTVGAGYDWQFDGSWVAGVFGDAQFGELRGSLNDPSFFTVGEEKLRTSYAAGGRLGYLVAPNVLSYVNAGYSGSQWSGTTQLFLSAAGAATSTTPSFRRDGWFVGGGVENNLDIFGINAPGWFMKTEYRSAYYDRITLPETNAVAAFGVGPTGTAMTFKPWVQTISTSLVYRFNSTPSPAVASAALYTKAPVARAYNWTGFYVFGGGGGGLWNADSNVTVNVAGVLPLREQRFGGSGWFGTVGAGYDWQMSPSWVAGVFADGQFGNVSGSIADPIMPDTEGREKLRTSYAAGVRLGYLVAPKVLSYVNGGYSGSDWSGATLSEVGPTFPFNYATTPSFHRDGWFIGGGVENNLNILGISAPGWFMKTEYRSAFYNRATLPETLVPAFGGGPSVNAITFKPWVQTISTSLVYRFNWSGAPASAR